MDPRQLKYITDQLKDHELRIDQFHDLFDEKMDKQAVEALVSSKIGKDEIADLLPDM